MLCTITQFSKLAADVNGAALPIGHNGTCAARTSAGAFAAVSGLIRIATDTAITLNLSGATPELFMPGVEYRKVSPGQVITLAVV